MNIKNNHYISENFLYDMFDFYHQYRNHSDILPMASKPSWSGKNYKKCIIKETNEWMGQLNGNEITKYDIKNCIEILENPKPHKFEYVYFSKKNIELKNNIKRILIAIHKKL